jgi:hypothetical protein
MKAVVARLSPTLSSNRAGTSRARWGNKSAVIPYPGRKRMRSTASAILMADGLRMVRTRIRNPLVIPAMRVNLLVSWCTLHFDS